MAGGSRDPGSQWKGTSQAPWGVWGAAVCPTPFTNVSCPLLSCRAEKTEVLSEDLLQVRLPWGHPWVSMGTSRGGCIHQQLHGGATAAQRSQERVIGSEGDGILQCWGPRVMGYSSDGIPG